MSNNFACPTMLVLYFSPSHATANCTNSPWHIIHKKPDGKYEPWPDAQSLTGHGGDQAGVAHSSVDYGPPPEQSPDISAEHEALVKSITSLWPDR
jgi:hypothetical protein